MTSRFDHLIHKHATKQRRRIAPGMLLTAAAFVAAMLFLAAFGTAEAHDPSEDGSAVLACAGSGTLAPRTGAAPVSRTASAGDCELTVSVQAAANAASTCQISYTPTAMDGGYDVAVFASGDCDGVQIRTALTVDDVGDTPSALAYTQSSGSRAALSKIYGHEVLALPMFFHYSRAEWYWTNNLITSASPYIDRWPNANWHIHTNESDDGAFYSNGNSTYSAWVFTSFHSDGYPTSQFPDVWAESEVQINVHAGGGYDCDFDFEWTGGEGNYPNLHYHTQCWASPQ